MITLSKAKAALEAAEHKAKEFGVAVSISIVDDHGTLIAMSRMDGTITISPRFSHAKAFTSATVGFPTSALGAYAKEDKPYFGVNTVLGGELTIIPGGVPVMMDGKLVGAVGVGGSQDVNQDEEIAKAALAALN